MTDLRERVAGAIARANNAPESQWSRWANEAGFVLAELGLTQAEPVAWQYRRSPDSQWLPVCAGSALALVGDGDEYRPLYPAPQPQPQAEPVGEWVMVPRERVQHACDLLAERVYGNKARSPGHNARLVLEAMLAAAPQPQGEPLFLLHTGTIYGNERGDWDVEANSGKAVDAYCDSRPGQTIGLYPAPQPQPQPQPQASAEDRPQPDWRHLWSQCRRVMDKWHAQAVELGYDGVMDLLDAMESAPQPQAEPVLVVNRHMLDTLGKDRWIPAMLPTDERAPTDALLYTAPAQDYAQVVEALREAREAVYCWGQYASPYFQEKHDLAGDLAKIDAAIAAIGERP